MTDNKENEIHENETIHAEACEAEAHEAADASAESETLQADAAEPASEPASGPSSGYVTMIEDPYGFKTLDIVDAHRTDDELDLDDEELDELGDDDLIETRSADLEADEAQLDSLAEALQKESAKQAAVAAEAVAEAAAEAQAEIEAAQQAEIQAIAEAEALEAAEKAEAARLDPELLAAMPQLDEQGRLDVMEVMSCIEALLFMSDKPVSLEKLYEWLCPPAPEAVEGEEATPKRKSKSREEQAGVPSYSVFQEAVTLLKDHYKSVHHGFELAEVAGGLQFRTKPGRAALAKRLAKIQFQRLSGGAMETLAIVSYRQPVLKEDIDKVRGVDSSYFIRNLLDRKMIEISGRSELPGRPLLYSTTKEFLELFGLKDLSALPPLAEIERMVPASQSKDPSEEDPRIREMRRLVGEMKADRTSIAYDPKEDEKILHEIRERVSSIPTSTPYLEEQKAQEKAAAELAKLQAQGLVPPVPEAPVPAGGDQQELV